MKTLEINTVLRTKTKERILLPRMQYHTDESVTRQMSLAWGTNQGYGSSEYNGQLSQILASPMGTNQYPYGYSPFNERGQPWPSSHNFGGGYYGTPGHMYQQALPAPHGPPPGLPPGLHPGMQMSIPAPHQMAMPTPPPMAPPPERGHQTHPPHWLPIMHQARPAELPLTILREPSIHHPQLQGGLGGLN